MTTTPPDVLARLQAAWQAVTAPPQAGFDIDIGPDAEPAPIINLPTTGKTVCRCGSTTWRDVPIHDGQSVRRDCGRCGRFIDFQFGMEMILDIMTSIR